MTRFTACAGLSLVMCMSVTQADYLDLTSQAPYEQCGYCHEIDGNPLMSRYPRLAGQQTDYLTKQLSDFRAGHRVGEMQATAETLSDRDIKIVARYFNGQDVSVAPLAAQPDNEQQLAKQLYQRGDAERGLPACSSCHGNDGLGLEQVPRLSGQHEDYLLEQFSQFKEGLRSNDPDGQMRVISNLLNLSEMRALAAFLRRMPASGAGP